jgi:hypothetical protein
MKCVIFLFFYNACSEIPQDHSKSYEAFWYTSDLSEGAAHPGIRVLGLEPHTASLL